MNKLTTKLNKNQENFYHNFINSIRFSQWLNIFFDETKEKFINYLKHNWEVIPYTRWNKLYSFMTTYKNDYIKNNFTNTKYIPKYILIDFIEKTLSINTKNK